MSAPGRRETILITSYLEPDLVARIDDAWAGEVHFDPALVPAPRYVADHGGDRPELDPDATRRWRDLLARTEIAFDFDWFAPGDILLNCPRLRWIQATSAGIGGFVQRYGLDRSEVVFTTAAGVHAVPLAEFAVTGALYFVKGIPHLLSAQRRHQWQRYTTTRLAGLRVTVVGLGAVGLGCVRAFAGLGTLVTGVGRPGRRYDVPAGVHVTDDLDTALATTDILVLATPLTDLTRGLVDARRIGLLPGGAIVINVARGPVLEQGALLAALDDGRLRGAALDVTDPEPPPSDDPIWDRPDVLLSPHSASTVAGENAAIVDIFLDNLDRWARGAPLRNVYTASEGY